MSAMQDPERQPPHAAPFQSGSDVTPAADTQEAQRLQALTADISARLRKVCGDLSDQEFSDLVLDIAQVRLRYEDVLFTGLAPRPKLERSD
jgi:hypothetical protein